MPEFEPPALSPNEFRRLGARAVEIASDYFGGIRGRKVVPVMPDDRRRSVAGQTLPEEGDSPDEILDFIARNVLPYPLGNDHPRFFAWVNSPPAPVGVLAEFLATSMNAPYGGVETGPLLEDTVSLWLMDMIGFPSEGSRGVLLSGGSMANLTALATARFWAARRMGWDIRAEGLQGSWPTLMVYASEEGHSCIRKSVEMLGLGGDNLRLVPVDENFRMRPDLLAQRVAADREAGHMPFCVVASAGTVNTGAIDPLDEIAAICEDQDLWFHIDGAYGAFGALDPDKAPLYRGLDQAQSVAIDPHKWLSVPIESGWLLMRDGERLRDTFHVTAPYVRLREQSEADAESWPNEYGFELTRSFRGLKAWATIRHRGRAGIARTVARHNGLARYLATAIEAAPDLEMMAPVTLSIVCFRYRVPGCDDIGLDALNQAIAETLNESGDVFFTPTVLRGRTVLRATIIHYDTNESDLDFLVARIRETGQALFTAK